MKVAGKTLPKKRRSIAQTPKRIKPSPKTFSTKSDCSTHRYCQCPVTEPAEKTKMPVLSNGNQDSGHFHPFFIVSLLFPKNWRFPVPSIIHSPITRQDLAKKLSIRPLRSIRKMSL
jgi:hypothetical protein